MATQATSRLERFRANRNSYFREHQNSPLIPEQKESFTALDYYPEDPALRFEVTLEEATLDLAPIEVGTGTDEAKTYTPAGWVEIPIEGGAVRFVVFREQGRGRYFLPFRDGTAGRETYGAGRYVDPQETPRGTLIIDFNYAYNPYCAYGDHFVCVIPPFQNRTTALIRAGERAFDRSA
jgi:uncharacterized protein (DUF1684 family)